MNIDHVVRYLPVTANPVFVQAGFTEELEKIAGVPPLLTEPLGRGFFRRVGAARVRNQEMAHIRRAGGERAAQQRAAYAAKLEQEGVVPGSTGPSTWPTPTPTPTRTPTPTPTPTPTRTPTPTPTAPAVAKARRKRAPKADATPTPSSSYTAPLLHSAGGAVVGTGATLGGLHLMSRKHPSRER